jgi:TraM recognition site of TraD and TraG
MRLSAHDALTLRDLCEGMLVLGNPGSGKSSTTGTILPLAALAHGWGVVAYTTKPDDARLWVELCRKTGRLPHLRVVRPDGGTFFNIIRYELERPTAGGGNSLRLASQLMEVFREGKPNAMPTEAGEFFTAQGQILLCNAIDALRLAGEPVSFGALSRFVETTPKHALDLREESFFAGECCRVLRAADSAAVTPAERELYQTVSRYFLVTFPNMNERTRGDVLATCDSALFELTREPFRQLLDAPPERGCSFVPEMLEDGAVLVIDCPVSVHGPVGRMLTICFKRLVKDMLRRRMVRGETTRPILNFCDECQTYVTRDDADFQQVCRSNRVVTAFLTQSIDNLEAVLGNDAHTNALANALTTHIYHCTSGRTAEWIQKRVAEMWRSMQSTQYGGRRPDEYTPPSVHVSEALHPQLLASELTRLSTGGPRHGRLVDAIVFKPGRRFAASGGPLLRVRFRQG